MDVQAIAPTLSSTTFTLPPLPGTPDATAAPSAAPAAVAAPATPPPSSGSGGSGSGSTASSAATAGPDPGAALLPPAPSGGDKGSSLASNVGKVFNASSPDSYSVSFQTAEGTNEIVTVVTDKQTGKVVTQFPSETLIALAKFFEKIDSSTSSNGAVLDKKV